MIVDDSAVVRGMIARILEKEPDIEVARTVANGEAAIHAAESTALDVILLDVEMPVMDGLTALPRLVKVAPHAKVIMNSTLTRRNAAVTIQALGAGAADFITKPSASGELNSSAAFGRELVEKIRALSGASAARPSAQAAAAERPRKGLYPDAEVRLRGGPLPTPRVLAIGSSTGGPQALLRFFEGMARTPALPIVITQHMPPTFTAILAEHLARASGTPCAEGAEGAALEPGKIYVAPGGRHLLIEQTGTGPAVHLDNGPPENFCKPAVDPMLRSLVKSFGRDVWAVILTGMGQDGLKGCRALVETGGAVFAQDEASSVVWGMPGAVATHGLCHAVLAMDKLGAHVARLLAEKGR